MRTAKAQAGSSRGGKTQSQQPYYCQKCDAVAKGNRFASMHLDNECDGKPSKKVRRSDKENRHLLNEALQNTRIRQMQQALAEERADYQELRKKILINIEAIKEIGDGTRQIF